MIWEGNVWEWCENTYQLYKGNPRPFKINSNIKVQKGGAFLCDEDICHGYRVSARQPCSEETSLMHVGFRCACDRK